MATNPYVNKVGLADGTTLIDLTVDTAVASDVASGKYFHLSTGERVQGTASGGGGITTVTILPAQSVTATTPDTSGYTIYLDNITENLISGENYIVTIDGVAYTCHAETAWGSVYAGDVEVIWGTPSNSLYPFLLGSYANNRTEWGYGDNNAHTVKIERVVSFSAPELISKTITANGVYNPAYDNADGYSEVTVALPAGTAGTPTATKGTVSNHSVSVTPSVTNTAGMIPGGTINGTAVTVSASELVSGSETKTANGTYDVTNLASLIVNVSGGASNVATGAFKGTTTGAAMDVTLNYSGSGHPVAILIYIAEGPQNTGGTFYSLVQRYAMQTYMGVNTDPSSSSSNTFMIISRYKSSSSNGTSYSQTARTSYSLIDNIDASGGNSYGCVTIKSNTKMSVWIPNSNYGFAANYDYKYWVLYSS